MQSAVPTDYSLEHIAQIRDQYDFSDYYNFPGQFVGYFGQLQTIKTDRMYRFQIAEGQATTMTVTGLPVALPMDITLNAGWTWVPNPYQESILIGDALPTGVTFTQDDQFKGQVNQQTRFTTYYEGFGWYPQPGFTHVVPGTGYMLKLNGPSSAVTATYQPYSGRRQLASQIVTSPEQPEGPTPKEWVLNAGRYVQTMSVTALVSANGVVQSSGTLAAFVGSEIRGLQHTASVPPFGAHAGKALYLITVYANKGGESVGFQYFNGQTKTLLDKTFKFVVDGKEGSVLAPLELAERPKLFG